MSALKICPVCSTEYPANERFCPRDGSALRTQGAANDLVGTIIAERYHVLKKLGEGGMGQVYLAEHVKMGRKSAVKVMHPGMVQDVNAISRFNREASNASRINHPNVAGIYDFGETADGMIYLAMEFVEGEPLTNIIRQHGALPPMRASEIARQTAEGLSVAHEMGIVHRDLKPDNIMVAKGRAGADLVKVVDFGIAKAAASDEQKVTKTGMVVGTPEYMSPEQLSGDPLDSRSDIYSLALMTFNMLTGKLPFPGETMQETMIMRLTDEPHPLSAMKPDVLWPGDLQQVMDKALARDVKKRYSTSSEFAHDLVQAIDRMPATSMTAMGTQILSSDAATAAAAATAATVQVQVPPTRVAARSGPSDRVSPAPSTAHTPTKSKTPMFVGVGVLAAGIIGFVAFKSMGSKSPNTLPAAITQGAAIGTAAHPDSVVNMSNRIPETAAKPLATHAQIKAFDDTLAFDATAGNSRRVLSELKKLDVQGVNDIVAAAVVEATAEGILGNQGRQCEILREVSVRAEQTEQAKIVKQTIATCPPIE